ncbi:MAG: hypothetical protein RDU25_00800 [Patescibacteria group bacterium]|nr:hypothetical protein [Patescibacteria group bacterium]
MALHILLNEEAYTQLVKDQVARVRGVGNLNGCKVYLDPDGRPYYEVRNDTGPMSSLVPFGLRALVDAFSWHAHLPPDSPTKMLGRYIFQTAEAVVDHNRDKQGWRKMRIHGPKLEDVYRLYYMLRAGTAELMESWQETEAVLDQVIHDSLGLSDELAEQNAEFIRFQCPICATEYAIKAGKVRGKTIRTTCKKCGNTLIMKDGVVDETSIQPRIQLVKPPKGGNTN